MADFELWYPKTSREEAGYCNWSKDPGKETVCGITRRDNPNCDVWPIVDAAKKKLGLVDTTNAGSAVFKKIDAELATVPGFQDKVKAFYRASVWNALNLDAEESQLVADTTADIGVNQGVPFAKAVYKKSTEGL